MTDGSIRGDLVDENNLTDEGYSLRCGPAASALVRATLDRAVRPHLQDVRAMLRLPLPEIGITAGCNFAAVHVLLNVLSGLSRLMEPGDRNSGKAFKHFVGSRYPWKLEPPQSTYRQRRGTTVLYDYFRTGFSHDLGLLLGGGSADPRGRIRARFPTTGNRLGVRKQASLAAPALLELDDVLARPGWLGPTIFREPNRAVLVDAVALYWGTRRLIFDRTATKAAVRSLEQMLQESSLRRASK